MSQSLVLGAGAGQTRGRRRGGDGVGPKGGEHVGGSSRPPDGAQTLILLREVD